MSVSPTFLAVAVSAAWLVALVGAVYFLRRYHQRQINQLIARNEITQARVLQLAINYLRRDETAAGDARHTSGIRFLRYVQHTSLYSWSQSRSALPVGQREAWGKWLVEQQITLPTSPFLPDDTDEPEPPCDVEELG